MTQIDEHGQSERISLNTKVNEFNGPQWIILGIDIRRLYFQVLHSNYK